MPITLFLEFLEECCISSCALFKSCNFIDRFGAGTGDPALTAEVLPGCSCPKKFSPAAGYQLHPYVVDYMLEAL